MEGVHPPASPGWADFTILMECTPESVHCPLCTLWLEVGLARHTPFEEKALFRVRTPYYHDLALCVYGLTEVGRCGGGLLNIKEGKD